MLIFEPFRLTELDTVLYSWLLHPDILCDAVEPMQTALPLQIVVHFSERGAVRRTQDAI